MDNQLEISTLLSRSDSSLGDETKRLNRNGYNAFSIEKCLKNKSLKNRKFKLDKKIFDLADISEEKNKIQTLKTLMKSLIQQKVEKLGPEEAQKEISETLFDLLYNFRYFFLSFFRT